MQVDVTSLLICLGHLSHSLSDTHPHSRKEAGEGEGALGDECLFSRGESAFAPVE